MHFLGTLFPTPPFELPVLLRVLAHFSHPTLDVGHEGAYWRVLRQGAGAVLVRVEQTQHGDQPALAVYLVEEVGQHGLSAADICARLAHILHIHQDRRAFYTLVEAQPTLKQVIAPLYGLPAWRTANLYEALVMTIIEQQIAWKAALKAQRWLAEWGGLTLQGVNSFPTPERLAAATPTDLTPTRITFKRMNLLIHIAQHIAAGQLQESTIAALPPLSAYAALKQIKGIGDWTAAVSLSRAYGYHHWVTLNDVALQRAANHYWYGQDERLTAEALQATFAPFGDYAGQVAYYTLLRWVLDTYPQVNFSL